MLVEQLFEPGLGHASYLCADPEAGVAFVVDPRRDVETYLAAASRLGVLITHTFETHVHNDYLSGSRTLASLRPIEVVAPRSAGLRYRHRPVDDGDTVRVGALEVRALATPGHTPEHMAYVVADLRRASDPQYLFSGGALLVGQIARVDLLGPDLEPRLARDAYETLRERVLALADHMVVFPTHGGGSSCSAAPAGSRWTTLGFERRHNSIAAAAAGEFDSFRAAIGAGLPAAPPYYPHVRERNFAGAPPRPRGPLPQLGEGELTGAVLVDPRPPHVFGEGHRPGALNIVGNDSFVARLGATVPYGAPVVILSDDAEQAERLRDQCAAIGYDDVRGYAPPDAGGEGLRTIEQVDARGARRRAADGDVILDVREPAEREEGYIPGSIHIPYAHLRARMHELPRGRPVLAYCASGIRSSLAASMLAADGREARNLRGGFIAWRHAGLDVAG
ncbi:MAG TPA: MBL fold metallo-hydrolase [Candidatus Limnocylindria bacterium]|nr:MBL fold metallo-hydrolase [Candidatus Limnocylindria bacterium]